MRIILFALMILFGWVATAIPWDIPQLLFTPIALFITARLISERLRKIATWWLLAFLWPASFLAIELFFFLPGRFLEGIPYTLDQFNESLIWACGLSLIQYAVFYLLHGVWGLIRRTSH